MSIFSEAQLEFSGNYMWQCFILFLDLSSRSQYKSFAANNGFFTGTVTTRETLVLKWFWLNMNGNVIYHMLIYGIHIHKGDHKLEGILTMISCPQWTTFLSLSFRCTPLISLVMWEWWSRDNGSLSFYMRQEDSLQALTCFTTGERNASCYLPHPRASTVVSLTFPFHHQFHLWSFISARAATHSTQSSIAKCNTETCLCCEWGGALWLQTQSSSSICFHRNALRRNQKGGKATKLDPSLVKSGSYCRVVKKTEILAKPKKTSTLDLFANHS